METISEVNASAIKNTLLNTQVYALCQSLDCFWEVLTYYFIEIRNKNEQCLIIVNSPAIIKKIRQKLQTTPKYSELLCNGQLEIHETKRPAAWNKQHVDLLCETILARKKTALEKGFTGLAILLTQQCDGILRNYEQCLKYMNLLNKRLEVNKLRSFCTFLAAGYSYRDTLTISQNALYTLTDKR